MIRRRERKRPLAIPRTDQFRSYGVNFKSESKDALVSYLTTWLEFDSSQELIMYKHFRVMTLFNFTKPDYKFPFKMLVIRKSGLSFLLKYIEDCSTIEQICKRLHAVFHQLIPEEYDKIKYYILDIAHYLELQRNHEMDSDQCSCILLRIEYYTYKTIFNYLTDVAFTKTDPTVMKYQLFE